MDITIAVPRMGRDGKGEKNWKEPFKKLKLSKIRAEDEWHILLRVNAKDAKRIHKFTADRLTVETVMKEDTKETWADKIALLGKKEKV